MIGHRAQQWGGRISSHDRESKECLARTGLLNRNDYKRALDCLHRISWRAKWRLYLLNERKLSWQTLQGRRSARGVESEGHRHR